MPRATRSARNPSSRMIWPSRGDVRRRARIEVERRVAADLGQRGRVRCDHGAARSSSLPAPAARSLRRAKETRARARADKAPSARHRRAVRCRITRGGSLRASRAVGEHPGVPAAGDHEPQTPSSSATRTPANSGRRGSSSGSRCRPRAGTACRAGHPVEAPGRRHAIPCRWSPALWQHVEARSGKPSRRASRVRENAETVKSARLAGRVGEQPPVPGDERAANRPPADRTPRRRAASPPFARRSTARFR